MDDTYFKKIITIIVLAILIVLSFLLVRPILLSITIGFILAFIFTPIYNRLHKIIKIKNVSSFLICFLLIVLIVLPLWFLTPVFIDQSIKLYLAAQQMDFVTPLRNIFPSLFTSEAFSAEIGSITHSFITNMTNSLMNSFSQLVLNFPTLLLQLFVVLFTFFFALRDKEKIVSYIKSLLPFSENIEKKLFKSTKEITSSVIYGQVIVGIIQGLIAGVGFFIFGVPNALLLTLFASLAGIFPIIGPFVVWIPVAIYLVIAGNTFSALGVILFGLIASTIDNFLRPLFVSKMTKIHPALILIGMIGGFLLFGVLGFILGPLILAYLIIVLEIYRNKKIPGILIHQSQKE